MQRGVIHRPAHEMTIDEEGGRTAQPQAHTLLAITFHNFRFSSRVQAFVELRAIQLQHAGFRLELLKIQPLAVENLVVEFPELALLAGTAAGFRGLFRPRMHGQREVLNVKLSLSPNSAWSFLRSTATFWQYGHS